MRRTRYLGDLGRSHCFGPPPPRRGFRGRGGRRGGCSGSCAARMKKMRKMLGLGRKRGAPEEGEEDEGHHPPSPPQRASLSAFYSGVAHRGPDTGKAHRYAAEGEVGRLLQQVRRKGPNPLDQHGRTPLHFACATGRVNVVGFLMRNKCQLDICDNDGISPLMKAIQCQQEPCALYLLDHGADAKLSDLHGNTALHLAAAKGSTTLVQRLLDHHTDLEAQNQDGSTPLMIAVSENGREMTEFLLKKGASVHVTDKAGRTPLLIAACHRNWDLASLLLSYGSDISHKDDSGWSVEDYATVCDAAALLQTIAEYSKPKDGAERSSEGNVLSALNSPDGGGDAAFILGAPAANIEVIDDHSLGDSLSDSGKMDKDPWHSSEEEELDFSPKKPQNPNLAQLINVTQQFKKNLEKSSLFQTELVADSQQKLSVCEAGDVHEFVSRPLFHVKSFPPPAHSSPGSFSNPSQVASRLDSKQEGSFEEEEAESEAEEDGGNPGIVDPNLSRPAVPPNQHSPQKDHVKMTTLKFGADGGPEEEDKDANSPWDSEDDSESPPKPEVTATPTSPARRVAQADAATEESHIWSSAHENVCTSMGHVLPEMVETNVQLCALAPSLLKQEGAIEKRKPDLMEELGLDDADDIKDASDWDSGSISQSLSCPAPFMWGERSNPAQPAVAPACPGLPVPKRVEETANMDANLASKGPANHEENVDEFDSGDAKDKSLIATPSSLEKRPSEKQTDGGNRFCPCNGNKSAAETLAEESNREGGPAGPALWEERYEKLWVAKEKERVKSDFKSITAELKLKFGEIDSKEARRNSPAQVRSPEVSGGVFEGAEESPLPQFKTAAGVQGEGGTGGFKSTVAEKGPDLRNLGLDLQAGVSRGLLCPEDQDQGRDEDLPPDPAADREGSTQRFAHLGRAEGGHPALQRCPAPLPGRSWKETSLEADPRTSPEGPVTTNDSDSRETGQHLRRGGCCGQPFGPEAGHRGGLSDQPSGKERDEALDLDVVRFKNEVGMLKVAFLALEKEKAQLRKEVEEVKRKQRLSGQRESEHPVKTEQKTPADDNQGVKPEDEVSAANPEANEVSEGVSSSDGGFLPNRGSTMGGKDRRKQDSKRQVSKQRLARQTFGDRPGRLDDSSSSEASLDQERHPGEAGKRRHKARREEGKEGKPENECLQEEELVALRAELDQLRARQEDESGRHREENEAWKAQVEALKKELKLNEEALMQARFQYNGEVALLKTEAALLASKLDRGRENQDRLEAELSGCRARLGAATQELEHSRATRRELERALQREQDEGRRLQDRLSHEAGALRESHGGLSQQLARAESRANALENELHLANRSLGETQLLLERSQGALSQAQGRVAELERAREAEKDEASKGTVKREALQERLAQLQSENLLLRQQLDEAQNKGLCREKAVLEAQERFGDIWGQLRADAKKQAQAMEEQSQELATACNFLREEVSQHKAEKADREGTIRQLQQELADSLKKQSMAEASLEVSTRYRSELQEERERLQAELERIKSKLQDSEEQHLQSERQIHSLRNALDAKEREASEATQRLRDLLATSSGTNRAMEQLEAHIQRLEVENAKLEAAASQQNNRIEMLQQDLQGSISVNRQFEERIAGLQEVKLNLEEQLGQQAPRHSTPSGAAPGAHNPQEEESASRWKLRPGLLELERENAELKAQLENEKKKRRKMAELNRMVETRLEQEMKRNSELQKKYNGVKHLVKVIQKKLKEYESRENSLQTGIHRDMKSKCLEIDAELGTLQEKLEAESRRRSRLESDNSDLLASAKMLRANYDDLRASKLQLEEEMARLQQQVQANVVNLNHLEQYKRDVEERAKQDVRQKLEEVNLFLQAQAASQDNLEKIRASHEASVRGELEKRIKDLESENGKLKKSQQESAAQKELADIELERYKSLYSEESQTRKSLGRKLDKANENLADVTAKLSHERHRMADSFWGASFPASPMPENATLGNLALNRPPTLAGGFVNPYSASGRLASRNRVEAFLFKMQRELEKSISKELDQARAEHDVLSARFSPIGSGEPARNLTGEPDQLSWATQEYLEVLKKNYML